METFSDVSWAGLAWSAALVLLVLALSYWQRLALEQRLLIGCLRTVVQLIAIGYVLAWIIAAANPWLVAAAAALQVLVAAHAVGGLLQHPLRGSRVIALFSITPAYLLVLAVLLILVVAPAPWFDPRIVLPLGGMLLGNAVTGVALALNRYRADIEAQRELIYARLALGAQWSQAVAEPRQQAAYAAVLPTVAAMYTVGLVAIPGMMSGQIIAGINPLAAVKYQIVVMFMIAAAVALAVTIALSLVVRRRGFEPAPAKGNAAS